MFDTISLSIGAIVGAGIFVLTGLASQVAGPALILSVLIASFVATLTAISISNLVRAFPKEGGEYEYGYKILSPFAGFISGWMWTLNKMVAGGVLVLGFATYLSAFFPFIPLKETAVTLIGLVTLINHRGVRTIGTAIDFLVILKLSILIFFIVLGSLFIKADNFFPFAPQGVGGVLHAAAIIFFAYVGFARPVYLVEEIKNPRKNIPKGIFLGLSISTVIYLLVTIVAIGLVGSSSLARTDSPLAIAIASTNVNWAPNLIVLGGLIATFSVLLDDNLALSRMIFAIGRKGDYPKWFAKIEKKSRAPRRAILATGMITAILTFLFDLRQLAEVASFLILTYFALVNLSAIKMEKKKLPAIIPVIGFIGTLSLALSLAVKNIIIGLLLISIGIVYFHLKRSASGTVKRNVIHITESG
ncbi:MAG: amino acid permease [Candidatus Aenigmarchaeota archaeon]|nr:amino acid permease [Candidatus Aenigmarchaeota archaeon]